MPADIKEYKNPAATASMLVVNLDEILLVKRKHEPYAGMWALPGGFLECDKECLEETAIRELREETHLIVRPRDLCLYCVNSSPTRDPRGHVIDHVYLIRKFKGTVRADDDAEEFNWFKWDKLPKKIAFDHGDVLRMYCENYRIRMEGDTEYA
jgi:8-oxo-dGTP diphosphatase